MQGLKKKAKPLNQMKSIHTEHITKLQTKQQLETDLLDDVKNFCKQRAVIEKEYGQALQKLATSYLVKRELIGLSGTDEENKRFNARSMWYVWRCILDQTVSIAEARMKAADGQVQLSEKLKPLRTSRTAATKRILEQLKSLQCELMECLQEMAKAHKIYAEEEKQAHDARHKAKDAEDKVRKRSTNLFNSMANLHKNSAKLSTRRTTCENRSTAARNEYLFQLAAINAHLEHYFTVDVPDLSKIMDGELYEKMAEVFSSLIKHEIESREVLREEDATKLLSDAAMINREITWQQFIRDNPTFAETIQYQFVPTEGDVVHLLYPPSEKRETLVNVSKKLVKRLVLREKKIQDYQEEMSSIQNGKVSVPFQQRDYESNGSPITTEEMMAYNQEYMEHKTEDLHHTIRRGEIEMVKIKACLQLLKDSGVDVDTMLNEAYTAMAAATAARENSSSRSPSGTSAGEAELEAEDAAHLRLRENTSVASSISPRGDRQLRRSLWAIDRSVDGSTTNSPSHGTSEDVDQLDEDCLSGIGEDEEVRAVVLFEFRASQPDEMDVVVDEELIVLGRGECDGWLKVRSKMDSREGLVPASFIKTSRPLNSVSSRGGSIASLTGNQSTPGNKGRLTNHVTSPTDPSQISRRGSRQGTPGDEADADEEEEEELFHTYINWGPKNTTSSTSVTSTSSGSVVMRNKTPTDASGSKQSHQRTVTIRESPELIENHVAGPSPRAVDSIPEDDEDESHCYVNIPEEELERLRQRRKENRRSILDPAQASAAASSGAQDIVRARVEFVGSDADELTFHAGNLIRVLARSSADGVDDGWWEGELVNPSTRPGAVGRGFFPSLAVEPLRSSAGESAASASSSSQLKKPVSKSDIPFSPPAYHELPNFTPPFASKINWSLATSSQSTTVTATVHAPASASLGATPLVPVAREPCALEKELIASIKTEKRPISPDEVSKELLKLKPEELLMFERMDSVRTTVAHEKTSQIVTQSALTYTATVTNNNLYSSGTSTTTGSTPMSSTGGPALALSGKPPTSSADTSSSSCFTDDDFPLPPPPVTMDMDLIMSVCCSGSYSGSVSTCSSVSTASTSVITATSKSTPQPPTTLNTTSSLPVLPETNSPLSQESLFLMDLHQRSSSTSNPPTASFTKPTPSSQMVARVHGSSSSPILSRSPRSSPSFGTSLINNNSHHQPLKMRTKSRREREEQARALADADDDDDSGGEYVKLSQQTSGPPHSVRSVLSRTSSSSPNGGGRSNTTTPTGIISSSTGSTPTSTTPTGRQFVSVAPTGTSLISTGTGSSGFAGTERRGRSNFFSCSSSSSSTSSGSSGISGVIRSGETHRVIKPTVIQEGTVTQYPIADSKLGLLCGPNSMCTSPSRPGLTGNYTPSSSPSITSSSGLTRVSTLSLASTTASTRGGPRPVGVYPVSEVQRMGMICRAAPTTGPVAHKPMSVLHGGRGSNLTPASSRVSQAMIEAAGAIIDQAEYRDTSDEEYDVVEV